ncbi:MAG: hypothetical protein QF921_00525 [Pseudomonadales bacterium]|jgi:hypothetical protein|nr:hypothetical protein [Pseudomonadales bacterium]MDP6472089.1 hypothetical protein [Pseudomonadales bacterium]MDP6826638.1 hypothetical protein [Pseudomonadales bacterium]MDP6970001.1 hypothetical protein [Pseudomonadales bacterium]|tara:strand:+ start:1055 stop:1600 length:546 start_codon:yes stop_codon:yes gene_type:complete
MRFIVLVGLLAFGGCSSIDLDPRVPEGFDLSGRWRLNSAMSDQSPDPRALRGEPREVARRERAGLAQSSPRGGSGAMKFIVQDFPILAANSLDIEQNEDSMGVKYDHGAYRDVSWGYRERGIWEVWAGWEEGVLVILSEANDVKAREALALEPGGERLVVDLQVRAERRDVNLRRVFDRVR